MKKYLKQLKANKKGFTLIEMIVVIAIIGILAAILVPSMAGYLNQAKGSKNVANAKTVYTAAQAAVTDLESTTTPVTDGVYKTEITNSNGIITDTATDTTGKPIFTKIQSLIGSANYGKIKKIKLNIKGGAVNGISITDSANVETIYPEGFTFPTEG